MPVAEVKVLALLSEAIRSEFGQSTNRRHRKKMLVEEKEFHEIILVKVHSIFHIQSVYHLFYVLHSAISALFTFLERKLCFPRLSFPSFPRSFLFLAAEKKHH